MLTRGGGRTFAFYCFELSRTANKYFVTQQHNSGQAGGGTVPAIVAVVVKTELSIQVNDRSSLGGREREREISRSSRHH